MSDQADVKVANLNRVELLELLVEQGEQLEKMQKEVEKARAQAALQERIARLAEDAVARLAGMLEGAQLAQAQYEENLRDLKAEVGIGIDGSDEKTLESLAAYTAAYQAALEEATEVASGEVPTADYAPDIDRADAYAASSETSIDPSAAYALVAQEVYGAPEGQEAAPAGGSYASPALAASSASAAYGAPEGYDPAAYGVPGQPPYNGYGAPVQPPAGGYDISFIPEYLLRPDVPDGYAPDGYPQ